MKVKFFLLTLSFLFVLGFSSSFVSAAVNYDTTIDPFPNQDDTGPNLPAYSTFDYNTALQSYDNFYIVEYRSSSTEEVITVYYNAYYFYPYGSTKPSSSATTFPRTMYKSYYGTYGSISFMYFVGASVPIGYTQQLTFNMTGYTYAHSNVYYFSLLTNYFRTLDSDVNNAFSGINSAIGNQNTILSGIRDRLGTSGPLYSKLNDVITAINNYSGLFATNNALLANLNNALSSSGSIYSKLKELDNAVDNLSSSVTSSLNSISSVTSRIEDKVIDLYSRLNTTNTRLTSIRDDLAVLKSALIGYLYPTPSRAVYNNSTTVDGALFPDGTDHIFNNYPFFLYDPLYRSNIDALFMMFRYETIYQSGWALVETDNPNVTPHTSTSYRSFGYCSSLLPTGAFITQTKNDGYTYIWQCYNHNSTPITTPLGYLHQIADNRFNVSIDSADLNIDMSGVEEKLQELIDTVDGLELGFDNSDVVSKLNTIIHRLDSLIGLELADLVEDLIDDLFGDDDNSWQDNWEAIRAFLLGIGAISGLFGLFSQFDLSGLQWAAQTISTFWASLGAAQFLVLLPMTFLILNMLIRKEGIG